VKRELIPCLIELAQDSDGVVRSEAVENAIHLISLVPASVFKSSLLPLLTSVLDKCSSSYDPTTVCVARNITRICHNLHERGEFRLVKLCNISGFSLFNILSYSSCKRAWYSKCSSYLSTFLSSIMV